MSTDQKQTGRLADAFNADTGGRTRYSLRMDNKFEMALERLDREIVEAEARLQYLRERRRGAAVFLEYMAEVTPFPSEEPSSDDRAGVKFEDVKPPISPIDMVMDVFRANEGKTLTIDAVFHGAGSVGSDGPDRTQFRNAIHYAVRKGWIEKAKGRGQWTYPGNASAPVGAGAEDTREPANGSREEKGEVHGSGSSDDGGAHPPVAGEHLHLSDRASIGG